MPVLPIDLQPTFPLDHAKIARRKREAIWGSPRLLFARFLATGLKTVSPRSSFALRAQASWKELDDEITARVMREMVSTSNQQQDSQIRRLMMNLNGVGKWQYAISLGKFLLLKQHIEGDLHKTSRLTERKKEVEMLVDTLCQEVSHEIYEIANLNDKLSDVLTSGDQAKLDQMTERVSDGHSRLMHAYSTLSDTAKRVQVVMEPGTERPDVLERRTSELDRVIEVLREENEVAQAVDQRMRDELPRL